MRGGSTVPAKSHSGHVHIEPPVQQRIAAAPINSVCFRGCWGRTVFAVVIVNNTILGRCWMDRSVAVVFVANPPSFFFSVNARVPEIRRVVRLVCVGEVKPRVVAAAWVGRNARRSVARMPSKMRPALSKRAHERRVRSGSRRCRRVIVGMRAKMTHHLPSLQQHAHQDK